MHLSLFTDALTDARDYRLPLDTQVSILESAETTAIPDIPHITDADIQILLERIQECKMVEQVRSLLNTLPLESDNLLSTLPEA